MAILECRREKIVTASLIREVARPLSSLLRCPSRAASNGLQRVNSMTINLTLGVHSREHLRCSSPLSAPRMIYIDCGSVQKIDGSLSRGVRRVSNESHPIAGLVSQIQAMDSHYDWRGLTRGLFLGHRRACRFWSDSGGVSLLLYEGRTCRVRLASLVRSEGGRYI